MKMENHIKPKGYYYNAALVELERNSVKLFPRQLEFESYDQLTLSEISKNLIAYRRVCGESQSSFAAKVGISRQQYRKYEQAEDVIRLDVAHRLSILFGFPVFFLMSGSPYQALLNIPDQCVSFNRVWRCASALSDDYFLKLCNILSDFTGNGASVALTYFDQYKSLRYDLAVLENQDSIYISIAEGIKAVRQYFGCSQEYMAELMGIALCTYRDYERATQRPRFNFLMAVRWVAATGIDPSIILAGTEYQRIREAQDSRLKVLMHAVDCSVNCDFSSLCPLVEGFYSSCVHQPGTLQSSRFFNDFSRALAG